MALLLIKLDISFHTSTYVIYTLHNKKYGHMFWTISISFTFIMFCNEKRS